MRLYNTLSRSEEPFTPGAGNTVRMYTCGLTVYARGHIGNFRMFVCVDVLRRTLRHLQGYNVTEVVNFTDVDDRTIAGAQQAGMELRAYTDRYVAAFHEDANALGLEAVEYMPRATDPENIAAMGDLVASLESLEVWTDDPIGDSMAIVVHTAYHLGAIRQLLKAASDV